jgi:hypothetical protein
MNIHCPIRPLSSVDIGDLLAALPEPSSVLWKQGDFRNEELANGPHSTTRNLVRRHEWFNRDGIPEQSLDEAIKEWATIREANYPFAPCRRVATTSLCSVYMFPISSELDEAIDRCVNESVRMLCTPAGVVLRAMITALPPGKAVSRHRDDGLCARFAHRIHVPLVGNEGVVYKIGSYRLRLSAGVAYDFNNRWLHAVENASDFWRVNLILDYLEDGAVPNPWLRYGWRP